MAPFPFIKKLFKKKPVASVDLGSSGIKIAVALPEGEGFTLMKLKTAEYVESIYNPADVLKVAKAHNLAEIIRRNIPEDTEKLCFVLPGRFSILLKYTIEAGVNPDEYIRKKIAQDVPISDVSYDYFEIPGEKSEVVCLVARKDMLRKLSLVSERAGIEDHCVDTPFTALCNICNCRCETYGKTVAIVDIGKALTHLVVLKDGYLASARCLAGPDGNFIDKKIASLLKIPKDEAERMKVEGSVPEDVMEEVLNDFCVELREQLDSAVLPDVEALDEVFVTGGNATISGLIEKLSQHLLTNVQALEPLSCFELSEGVNLKQNEERYSLALGALIGSGTD